MVTRRVYFLIWPIRGCASGQGIARVEDLDRARRGLSNTVDQNPVVSPCFPSENRKSSGVKSYQVYWMHWTRIDSDGKVYFLFLRDLEKFRSCWMRGWKVVPMESIGSIGHE